MTRLRIFVVLIALGAAACGASEGVRNDDPPPSTVSNRCGETGECEGSAPDAETFLTAACTTWGAETDPGNWDLVGGCVALLAAAPTADVHTFLDQWLR